MSEFEHRESIVEAGKAVETAKSSKARLESVEMVLKLSHEDQAGDLRYLAKSPALVCLLIFELHRETFYTLLGQYRKSMLHSDIAYAALILSIGAFRAQQRGVVKKSFKDLSLDEIRACSATHAMVFASKFNKPTSKHEKLMGYWAIVRTLRLDHGFSYERIALYLKKKHRFSVAASTIMKKWKDIETTNEQENIK